jgi:hypothetical protein
MAIHRAVTTAAPQEALDARKSLEEGPPAVVYRSIMNEALNPLNEALNPLRFVSRSWLLWACLFLLSALLSAPAYADHRPAPAYVELEQLSVVQRGREVSLRYRVEPRSWEFLRHSGISPTLVISGLYGPRGPLEERFALSGPEDSLRLPLRGRPRPVALTVSFEGAGPRHVLSWMRLGEVDLVRATLLTRQDDLVPAPPMPPGPPSPYPYPYPTPNPGPPPPAPPPLRPSWASQPNVIFACASAFEGGANEQACLDAVAPAELDPTPLIGVCESAMDGDATELACLAAAVTARGNPLQAIAACESAMDGDDAELQCLRFAVRASSEPSMAIAACENLMDGDAGELECIRVVSDAPPGRNPVEVISACEAMSGDAAQLECVRRGLSRR